VKAGFQVNFSHPSLVELVDREIWVHDVNILDNKVCQKMDNPLNDAFRLVEHDTLGDASVVDVLGTRTVCPALLTL
jgi:hypothetical protein